MYRDSQLFKSIAVLVSMTFLFQIFYPTAVLALTSGPSQPETQSFTPAGMTDMVDPFSGDFSYNIPLMDVGGYPISLSYSAGVSMEQEASWVGLGWNINPGVISRSVRGVPDDFKGEALVKTYNIKQNRTYGGLATTSIGELFGTDLTEKALGLGVGLGAKYNNYSGIGLDYQFHPSIGGTEKNKSPFTASLGLSVGTSGVGVEPTVSFSMVVKESEDKMTNPHLSARVGSSFHSRAGLQEVSFGVSASDELSDFGHDVNKILNFFGFDGYSPSSRSPNAGGSISFSSPTYTPKITNSMTNRSLSVSFTTGTEMFGTHQNLKIKGYYSEQDLFFKGPIPKPAFGYLYHSAGVKNSDPILDFNREKDVGYSKEVKQLPVAAATFDVFSVSGEGIGGSYRLYRNDVGTVFDNFNFNISSGKDLGGLEVGALNTARGGVNTASNSSYTFTGRWDHKNSTYPYLNFRDEVLSTDIEPVYFRKSGEHNVLANPDHFNQFGGFDAISFDVDDRTNYLSAKRSYTTSKGQKLDLGLNPLINLNVKRQARNEAIVHYTALEAENYSMFSQVRDYALNTFNLQANGQYISSGSKKRYDDVLGPTKRKKHHISEINVYSADGRRYIYSDPIYNFIKKEATFAISNSPDANGLVSYSARDASVSNGNGLDNYFDKVETPAYPTAFLLTAIVSSDYADVDDINGPSDEDLGNYTKFNYTTVASDLNPYKWRTPYSDAAYKASYNPGFFSKGSDAEGDDKANYIYGEKEVKYLHSIETKTHVAEFYLNTQLRNDGQEAAGEPGGKGSARLRSLNRIELYSKQDKIDNPNDAVPIKTVHFEYFPDNEELCNGITNGNGGKLTLKAVYFTYGNSKRGKLSPYVFSYYDQIAVANDLDYAVKSSDRWGTFQETGTPNNDEYPYTRQDYVNNSDEKFKADQNAAAWNLKDIILPSGGKITVDYEADDYAFVQNKKAMQMFKVHGVSAGPSVSNGQELSLGTTSFDYIHLKMPDHYDDHHQNLSWQDFFIDYESGVNKASGQPKFIQELYFKMKTNIESSANDPGATKKEYVTGYAQIDYSYVPTVSGNIITLKVKKARSEYNPVSYATFNLVKKNFPAIAYQQPRMNESGVVSMAKALVGIFSSIKQLVNGIDDDMRNRGIGKTIESEKSWVRLHNPIGKKKGGGHRVKKITIVDNWKSMTADVHDNQEYGQEYDYSMVDQYNKVISSGVASYEPILGNEENPFRSPIYYDVDKVLVPDEQFYLERPMGELYFPGASVGYRKVTIKHLGDNPNNGAEPIRTVNEFYTAYDFPTRVEDVKIKSAHRKPGDDVLGFLKISSKDYVATSQGYVVELNDMHGKPKSVLEYKQGDKTHYSGVEYRYKQLSDRRISSRAMVMDKSGNISEKYIGLEYDIITDIRKSLSFSTSSSTDFNIDGFQLAIVPVVVPLVWPTYSKEVTKYNSIVVSKMVKRHGILDETIYYDQKSVAKTKNLIRDAESGEVILTQVENEFGDPLYNFKYPAYWAYEHMGPVYKNWDVEINMNNAAALNLGLMSGDKVAINTNGSISTAWVVSVNGVNTKFIDKDGVDVAPIPAALIKVIEPARTNQQRMTVGQVVSKQNPLYDSNGDGNPDELRFEEVLQASAMEFTQQSKIYCNCEVMQDGEEFSDGVAYNPYRRGTQGIWKPWREYNYVTDRLQTRVNDNVNSREDGVFYEFQPFWTVNSFPGKDWQANRDQWIFAAEATTFNPYGKELESRDALGRYSSAIFGYKHSLPTAVAQNARYRHIAFDGFEDYGTEDCSDDHFSFEQVSESSNISEEEAHSGRKSIKVTPTEERLILRKVLVECDNEIEN